MNTTTIFEALSATYWHHGGFGYSEYGMAHAAANAAQVENADIKALELIVKRNLDPVNFVLMANEIADALGVKETPLPEYTLTIDQQAAELLLWAERNPKAVKALMEGKAVVLESFWLDYLPPEEAKRLDDEPYKPVKYARHMGQPVAISENRKQGEAA